MVKYLAVGPGAMAYFAFIGKITHLKETGRLDELEEISGASAGSIAGFMYCLTNGDTKKIMEISLAINVNQLMKPNIKTLLTNYGLVPLKNMKKVISDVCLLETEKKDITFSELYEMCPIKLHVSSYCVQLENTKYFSVDTTPYMSVVDAICASIAVPFLFSSVTMEDGLNYIDGGYMELTPCGPFLGRDDVFCLKIDWGISEVPKDIKTYAMNLILANLKLRYSYSFPTQSIKCPGAFDFNASTDSKIKMYMSGYSQEFSQ